MMKLNHETHVARGLGVVAITLLAGALTMGCGNKTPAKTAPAPTSTAASHATTPTTASNGTTPRRVRFPLDSAIEIAARDPRESSHHPRLRAVLLTEVSSLSATQGVTPATSADAPALARRVAESYVELSRASDSRDDKRAARARAIASYEYLLRAFPNDPKKSEVLYDLALEYELFGVNEEAQRYYRDVVANGPKGLAALAQFGLGEIAMRESMKNPVEINDAIAAYARVMNIAAPSDPIFAEALARSADAYERAGDHAKADVARGRVFKEFGGSDAAAREQKARSTASR